MFGSFWTKFWIDESIDEVNTLLDFIPIIDTNQWKIKIEPLAIATSVPVSSIFEPPKLNLKSLLDTLKYAFPDDSKILPMIISYNLAKDQERKLLDILSDHKEVTG